MGVTKWILTGVGWAAGGPIGALLGYFIGRTIEGIGQSQGRLGDGSYRMDNGVPRGSSHSRFHNTGTQDDIDVALLVLIAAVMKADGNVRREELDYVKQFLRKNYTEEKGKALLGMLRDLVKPETYIDVDAVCQQIKENTDYNTRYHMMDFLFALAVADNSYFPEENTVIRVIAGRLGINSRDYVSMFTRHVWFHRLHPQRPLQGVGSFQLRHRRGGEEGLPPTGNEIPPRQGGRHGRGGEKERRSPVPRDKRSLRADKDRPRNEVKLKIEK